MEEFFSEIIAPKSLCGHKYKKSVLCYRAFTSAKDNGFRGSTLDHQFQANSIDPAYLPTPQSITIDLEKVENHKSGWMDRAHLYHEQEHLLKNHLEKQNEKSGTRGR